MAETPHAPLADMVLVAHPDPSVRAAVAAPLGAAGHRVAEAGDAVEVLGVLAHSNVALALVDAGLRCADGRSLILAMHADPDDEPVVIAIVGSDDDDAVLAAIDDGADDHLRLPVREADVRVRVSAALRGAGGRVGREQAALRRIATAVAREATPDSVFDQVALELARVHRVAGGAVVRFDDGEATFVGRWSRRPDAWPARDLTVPLTSALPTRNAIREDDFRAFAGAVPWVLDSGAFPGSVAAPVSVRDRLWGAVVVATDGDEPLPAATSGRLARFAELVALAIENAEARAELRWRAATDPLTGLVNRGIFEDRLAEEVARARRHGRPVSLAVLDLDCFKQVNDLHGHVVGDAVLREAALRLSSRAREGDVIGRLGGEEFGWLMPETDAMEAWQATERARAAMAAAAFPRAGRVTVSAGVCDLSRAGSALELYRNADTALYWAKRQGRDVVFLYSPEAMAAMGDEDRAAELRRQQAFQSIRVLARAVDAKDPATRSHSERVAVLASAIAHDLGWNRQRVALLHEAALVHDVGKIAVPDAVLLRPHRLGAREMAGIRAHAELGAQILADVVTPEQATWVRAHHERWDGSGYPDRLVAEQIPEGARILHLADSWETMTSERRYLASYSPVDATAECRRMAGAQFWGRAVSSLEGLWASGRLNVDELVRSMPAGRL